jgi:hypothetical protein
MAQYRFLADCFVGQSHILAGTTVSMADDWVPHGNCEPIDAAAIRAFWNAGPQLCGVVRPQWSNQVVTLPSCHWQCVNPVNSMYQLTGAGASLGPKHGLGMSLP